MRILVVDDDPFDRAYLEAVFSHRGHTVVTAPDGAAGLAEARSKRPDAIVSDVLMPRMDGYRFCRSVREDSTLADIPFVFYTATYTDPEDEKLASDLGADAFAIKPKEPAEIAELVEAAIVARHEGRSSAAPSAGLTQEYNDIVVRKLGQTVTKLETASRDLARYHLLFENAFDPTLFLTHDLRILEANPPAAARYGYSREGLVGLSVNTLRSSGADPESDGLLAEALTRPIVYETEHVSRDGAIFPVEVRARAVSLGGESVLAVILRDLTTQREQERTLRKMVDDFEALSYSAVEAFGKMVESRDPYTAGHQERVADLACRIGTRLGLSEERCKAIRLAGLVHDIGKIKVPAEILNKPGPLSDIEFQIIQSHVQCSYDILGKIDFPWPIAKMAYQHHERCDGSGYPNGLSGDEIMLEARILAVADVVEAMTFHRPYKEVAGLDAALAEIEANRGVLYDADVADALDALFCKDGYAFPLATAPVQRFQRPARATPWLGKRLPEPDIPTRRARIPSEG